MAEEKKLIAYKAKVDRFKSNESLSSILNSVSETSKTTSIIVNTRTGKIAEKISNKKEKGCYTKNRCLSLKDITHVVYLCQALSFIFGTTAVFGVVINYLKRSKVKNTRLKSHFT